MNSFGVFYNTPCLTASIAFAIMGSSPTGTVPAKIALCRKLLTVSSAEPTPQLTKRPRVRRLYRHQTPAMLRRYDDHSRGNLRATPVAAPSLEQHLMNSHPFTQENSIWQLADMSAGRRRFVDKAGGTPFSQRNQRHQTHQMPPDSDRHTVTGINQTNQAEMAATQFAKISCRAPSEAPLSP